MCTSVSDLAQAELMQTIREIMIEWPSPKMAGNQIEHILSVRLRHRYGVVIRNWQVVRLRLKSIASTSLILRYKRS